MEIGSFSCMRTLEFVASRSLESRKVKKLCHALLRGDTRKLMTEHDEFPYEIHPNF